MAKENTEIGDIVKKSKVLLLDIEGTTTSISFVKDKLFPYAEENVKDFLNSQWEQEDVKDAVNALRKLAIEDQEKSVEGLVAIPGEDASKEDQIEGLVSNVKWQMSSDRKVGPLKQLQGLIWKQGYDKGDIKGHIYDDVQPALEQWRSAEGQKIYIYSSGSVQAQKLLFGASSAGDLLPLIDGHFDTAVGAKQEATSYAAIVEKIGCKADEILFLTDIEKEAEAARSSGLNVALVSREGNAPLSEQAAAGYPVLHSFTQLTVSNKRKPDTQEEIPAKIPKTDVNDDVKTNSKEETTESATPEVAVGNIEEETEKMEVEETVSESTKPVEENVTETKIEEVTDVEIADVPAVDTVPVVEEVVDKAEEKKETEKMEDGLVLDAKPVEEPVVGEKVGTVADPVKEPQTNGADAAPVAEETPPAIITEIEEILDDKQCLSDVAEIIEDIEPVIEEPVNAEDIEELKNVGEVLDKECDEILSKVQDVTNLDSIPVKPLLNSIPEEAMDTENIDSNNIIEKILEAEMELGVQDSAKTEEIVDGLVNSKTVLEEKSANEEPVPPKPNSETKEAETIVPEKTAENDINAKSKESEVTELAEKPAAESQVEPVESKMDSEESKMESEESQIKSEESKMESVESKIESVETKMESVESETESVGNKIESAENKMETEENKMETEELKSDTKESKTETQENKTETVENTDLKEDKTEPEENKLDTEDSLMQTDENKLVTEETETMLEKPETKKLVEEKIDEQPVKNNLNVESQIPETDITEKENVKEMATESSATAEESKVEEMKSVEEPVIAEKVETTNSNNTKTDSANGDDTSNATDDVKVSDVKLNGNSTNGTEKVNGDSVTGVQLTARLSVENGKEVNGANGDVAEKVKTDAKPETEVTEIKVKTVPAEEPRNDPIEQPAEA